MSSAVEKFWLRVQKGQADECWPWTGSLDTQKYGRCTMDGARKAAHRFSYELLVGPIPEGLTLDHTCHDPKVCPPGRSCLHRRCVNPAHLEPVTLAENNRRGGSPSAVHAKTTHCPQGHPYEGDNLIVQAQTRRCRSCLKACRKAATERAIPPGRHGYASTYDYYACRCPACTTAHAVRRAAGRRKAVSS